MYNPQDCCKICSRQLGEIKIEDHHLVPKQYKGRVTIPIHSICHQKIHATFSERDLAQYYNTPERLLEHEEIQKFVRWVKKKPLEFYSKNDDTTERHQKRRKR